PSAPPPTRRSSAGSSGCGRPSIGATGPSKSCCCAATSTSPATSATSSSPSACKGSSSSPRRSTRRWSASSPLGSSTPSGRSSPKGSTSAGGTTGRAPFAATEACASTTRSSRSPWPGVWPVAGWTRPPAPRTSRRITCPSSSTCADGRSGALQGLEGPRGVEGDAPPPHPVLEGRRLREGAAHSLVGGQVRELPPQASAAERPLTGPVSPLDGLAMPEQEAHQLHEVGAGPGRVGHLVPERELAPPRRTDERLRIQKPAALLEEQRAPLLVLPRPGAADSKQHAVLSERGRPRREVALDLVAHDSRHLDSREQVLPRPHEHHALPDGGDGRELRALDDARLQPELPRAVLERLREDARRRQRALRVPRDVLRLCDPATSAVELFAQLDRPDRVAPGAQRPKQRRPPRLHEGGLELQLRGAGSIELAEHVLGRRRGHRGQRRPH